VEDKYDGVWVIPVRLLTSCGKDTLVIRMAGDSDSSNKIKNITGHAMIQTITNGGTKQIGYRLRLKKRKIDESFCYRYFGNDPQKTLEAAIKRRDELIVNHPDWFETWLWAMHYYTTMDQFKYLFLEVAKSFKAV